jgi:hypothetical protein
MNRRRFLAPLAVSVAALIGGAVVPAQASTEPGIAISEASVSIASDPLVLSRSVGGQLRLADHESHASHASHSSHVSGS